MPRLLPHPVPCVSPSDPKLTGAEFTLLFRMTHTARLLDNTGEACPSRGEEHCRAHSLPVGSYHVGVTYRLADRALQHMKCHWDGSNLCRGETTPDKDGRVDSTKGKTHAHRREPYRAGSPPGPEREW